jgi:hypothetical protein
MIDGANELHNDIKNTQEIVKRLEDTDHKLTEEVSIALKASTEISKKIMWNREKAAAEVAEMKIIALKILDSHNSNQKP